MPPKSLVCKGKIKLLRIEGVDIVNYYKDVYFVWKILQQSHVTPLFMLSSPKTPQEPFYFYYTFSSPTSLSDVLEQLENDRLEIYLYEAKETSPDRGNHYDTGHSPSGHPLLASYTTSTKEFLFPRDAHSPRDLGNNCGTSCRCLITTANRCVNLEKCHLRLHLKVSASIIPNCCSSTLSPQYREEMDSPRPAPSQKFIEITCTRNHGVPDYCQNTKSSKQYLSPRSPMHLNELKETLHTVRTSGAGHSGPPGHTERDDWCGPSAQATRTEASGRCGHAGQRGCYGPSGHSGLRCHTRHSDRAVHCASPRPPMSLKELNDSFDECRHEKRTVDMYTHEEAAWSKPPELCTSPCCGTPLVATKCVDCFDDKMERKHSNDSLSSSLKEKYSSQMASRTRQMKSPSPHNTEFRMRNVVRRLSGEHDRECAGLCAASGRPPISSPTHRTKTRITGNIQMKYHPPQKTKPVQHKKFVGNINVHRDDISTSIHRDADVKLQTISELEQMMQNVYEGNLRKLAEVDGYLSDARERAQRAAELEELRQKEECEALWFIREATEKLLSSPP